MSVAKPIEWGLMQKEGVEDKIVGTKYEEWGQRQNEWGQSQKSGDKEKEWGQSQMSGDKVKILFSQK